MKNVFTVNMEANLIACLATAFSFVAAYLFGYRDITWLEIAAVWTSYGSTYLCVVQSRSNYIWGFISVCLYAYIFILGNLFSSAAVQIYLAGALVYGWLRWGPDATTRPVRFTPLRLYPVYILVTLVIWGAASWTSSKLGGTVVSWDSAILAGSILAQFLLDNKRIETWLVWTVVNIIAITVYYQANYVLVVIQYMFFLINTGIGFYAWWMTYERDQIVEGY